MEFSIDVLLASRLLHKAEQFVRIGLQRQLLPLGCAVKTSTQWTYDIRPHMLAAYMGITLDELIERAERVSE